MMAFLTVPCLGRPFPWHALTLPSSVSRIVEGCMLTTRAGATLSSRDRGSFRVCRIVIGGYSHLGFNEIEVEGRQSGMPSRVSKCNKISLISVSRSPAQCAHITAVDACK
jgi:hypothetical protein